MNLTICIIDDDLVSQFATRYCIEQRDINCDIITFDDAATALKNFSLKIENFNPESKLLKRGYKNSDALFIDLAKDLLKEGGKLVCLLPHSIISNKEFLKLRKTVEEDWLINAVMVLPEGIFQETANTTTRADILILKKSSISKFIKKRFKISVFFCAKFTDW